MKTNVYVDGFNLYYGCMKGTPHRWLDLMKFCRVALPRDEIHRIRYFTALIHARPDDPQKPQRQQIYIRALKTIPNLSVHLGRYLSRSVRMALVAPPANGPRTVSVWKTEEKGSDVNLATYLLLDAFEGDCEAAVIVSNDSDLELPIRTVRKKFELTVGVLNPHRKTSHALRNAASFHKRIREGWLRISQFSGILRDSQGSFTRPATW